MKNILFITGTLLVCLLFLNLKEEIISDSDMVKSYEMNHVRKDHGKDVQRNFELISKDLKSSHGIARRNIQTTNFNCCIKLHKNTIRLLQYLRIKETIQLQKVSEYITTCQTAKLSALLCRMGYHVYALRKIII